MRTSGAWFRVDLIGTVLGAALLLGGCGGGDDDGAAAQSAGPAGNPPPANRAPTIAGSPNGDVLVGSQYSFTATANDADGDSLVFQISNLPSWASFDVAAGRLQGTPSAGDIGEYSGIVIRVSDGKTTTSLAPFSIRVVAATPGTAFLSWIPPSSNTDGSALTDLSGYRLYWGESAGSYEHSESVGKNVTSHVINDLTPNTWYFAITAINEQGIESSFSNVASKVVN